MSTQIPTVTTTTAIAAPNGYRGGPKPELSGEPAELCGQQWLRLRTRLLVQGRGRPHARLPVRHLSSEAKGRRQAALFHAWRRLQASRGSGPLRASLIFDRPQHRRNPEFRRRLKQSSIRRFSSAVEQRFCNSLDAVSPRFVLYQDVPDYWGFFAIIASDVSGNTVPCYRVR